MARVYSEALDLVEHVKQKTLMDGGDFYMISVGAGSMNYEELIELASDEQHAFQVTSLDQVGSLVQNVSDAVCTAPPMSRDS